MFSIQTRDMALLKNAETDVKNDTVSLRAKSGVVEFCCLNRASGVVLHHRVKAQVKSDCEFAVDLQRFLKLFSKETLTLSFDGSSLSYTSGNSKGLLETKKPYFENWPSLQANASSLSIIFDNLTLLDLKSEHHTVFVFGGQESRQSGLAVGDRDHAAFIPLAEKIDAFTLPLTAFHNARKLFKSDMTACTQDGVVFFLKKTETTRSCLRLGQIGSTDPLSFDAIFRFYQEPEKWACQIDSAWLKDILERYDSIKDQERTGTLLLSLNNGKISLSCKTRHGEASVENPVSFQKTVSVALNISLLSDIHKIDGLIDVGMKSNDRIFFLKNDKATYISAIR